MPLRSGQAKPSPSKKGSTISRGPWKMILPDDSTCARGPASGWQGGGLAGLPRPWEHTGRCTGHGLELHGCKSARTESL